MLLVCAREDYFTTIRPVDVSPLPRQTFDPVNKADKKIKYTTITI